MCLKYFLSFKAFIGWHEIQEPTFALNILFTTFQDFKTSPIYVLYPAFIMYKAPCCDFKVSWFFSAFKSSMSFLFSSKVAWCRPTAKDNIMRNAIAKLCVNVEIEKHKQEYEEG